METGGRMFPLHATPRTGYAEQRTTRKVCRGCLSPEILRRSCLANVWMTVAAPDSISTDFDPKDTSASLSISPASYFKFGSYL